MLQERHPSCGFAAGEVVYGRFRVIGFTDDPNDGGLAAILKPIGKDGKDLSNPETRLRYYVPPDELIHGATVVGEIKGRSEGQ